MNESFEERAERRAEQIAYDFCNLLATREAIARQIVDAIRAECIVSEERRVRNEREACAKLAESRLAPCDLPDADKNPGQAYELGRRDAYSDIAFKIRERNK